MVLVPVVLIARFGGRDGGGRDGAQRSRCGRRFGGQATDGIVWKGEGERRGHRVMKLGPDS